VARLDFSFARKKMKDYLDEIIRENNNQLNGKMIFCQISRILITTDDCEAIQNKKPTLCGICPHASGSC